MNTGTFNELGNKLGISRANKKALIGIAAILACILAVISLSMANAAASDSFEITTSDSAPLDSSSDAAPITLFVHVSGAVVNPGLYEVNENARVADAVSAAGGFTEDADESGCNLARIVEDGEHVIIPTISAPSSFADDGLQTQPDDSTSQSSLVNINTATQDQLESLPGIGAATAQKIVSERAANGPFSSTSDLTRVSGIGDKKLQALEGLICV